VRHGAQQLDEMSMGREVVFLKRDTEGDDGDPCLNKLIAQQLQSGPQVFVRSQRHLLAIVTVERRLCFSAKGSMVIWQSSPTC
jgi:hypothetical protein